MGGPTIPNHRSFFMQPSSHPPSRMSHLFIFLLLLFFTPSHTVYNNRNRLHNNHYFKNRMPNGHPSFTHNNPMTYSDYNANQDEDALLNLLPYNNTESFPASEGPLDFCEGTSFKADCSQHEAVVVILSARFGLMNHSKCIEQSNINSSCQKDVLDLMEMYCGGRRTCEMRVTKIVDHVGSQGCLKSVRGYLKVSYVCLPVVFRPPNSCTSSSSSSSSSSAYKTSSSTSLSHVEITEPQGFLASAITSTSGCGMATSPWLLEAGEAYTIELVLIDFTRARRSKHLGHSNSCNILVKIKEGHDPSLPICEGEQRISTVYVSQGNSISIDMGPSSSSPTSSSSSSSSALQDQPFFLLKYTITGCADIEEKNGLVVKRLGGVSVLYCEGTGDRTQVVCKDSSWQGTIPDCYAWRATASSAFFSAFWNVFSNSQWVAVATILSIALIIGVVIFISGILCLKKRRQSYLQEGDGTPRCLVEYHLPRPAHPLERNGSVHSKSLSLDIIGNNSAEGSNAENDYFRTWQMHERNNNLASIYQTHHNVMTSSFKPLLQDADDRGRSLPPPPDHIYESPNFDRKIYASQPPPNLPAMYPPLSHATPLQQTTTPPSPAQLNR